MTTGYATRSRGCEVRERTWYQMLVDHGDQAYAVMLEQDKKRRAHTEVCRRLKAENDAKKKARLQTRRPRLSRAPHRGIHRWLFLARMPRALLSAGSKPRFLGGQDRRQQRAR